ncbi:MAG: HAD-IA family hydrolase [Planctomycetes bacterium]|nr:HAD-IA family hydrolase [Planctomycetota bacterium]
MKPYLGLIFDCDGTLADTMPAHFLAWNTTLHRYNLHLPEDRFYSLGGVPTNKIVAMLADEAGLSLDVEAVAHEKELAFHEALHEIGCIEPVVAIAAEHRGKLPMAVATGSLRWSAERMLKHLNILDWFDALVCADDVTRHKPEPDVFLEAARRIGVAPQRACAYEDTDLGIEAARRAGMDCVDVRTMYAVRRLT